MDDRPARTPPHSLDAEMAALGSVLIKPLALDDLGDLMPDDFFLPQHREILVAMRAVRERGRPLDWIMIAEELKASDQLRRLEGGEMYLTKLANETPTAELARHYAGVVAEKSQLRRVIAMCADTMSQAYGPDGNADELLSDARRRLGEVEVMAPGGPLRVGDEVEGVVKRMEQRGQNPEESLVPTGIASVDEKIAGFRVNELVVVAANPGRGKTAFAFNMAVRAALRGIPALVFSLEMSLDQMVERAISGEARINGRHVSLGRMSSGQWYRVMHATGRLDKFDDGRAVPLYIDDRKLTASRICAEARRWRSRHPTPLALIVVDYLGLVEPDKEEKSREREVAKMSRMFKNLAHKTQANAPVVLISQLNRENMKNKDGKPRAPVLSDLRESGAIEQDADVVLFPWWQSEPAPTGRHPAQLIVGKFRNASKGPMEIDWWPEYTLFTDPESEEDRAQTSFNTEVEA